MCPVADLAKASTKPRSEWRVGLHAGKENRLPNVPLRRDDERRVFGEVGKRRVLTVKDKSQAERWHDDKPRQPGGQPPPGR